MKHQFDLRRPRATWVLVTVAVFLAAAAHGALRAPQATWSDGDVFETAEQKIRVVTVAEGLSHPWSLAFLPDGGMLVTERAGRLRLIRDGVLDPKPISGVPEVHSVEQLGLMDVALHPRFAENQWIYLTYTKPGERGSTTALARGRFTGRALIDVRELFVAEPWQRDAVAGASRIAFGHDGMLFMTVGGAVLDVRNRGQDPDDHGGKVLRLHDDGRVPEDNPFVGQPGYQPEIYSLGHRNQLGLAIHPETGAVWEHEQGPQGGDEVNMILPGRNYGWPVITYGRDYAGNEITAEPSRPGMEQPFLFWVPSIAVSGMAFYTGDRFPAWKGNVFVGSLRFGGFPRTGHVQRLVFSDAGLPLRRELLLTELKLRIRDVRQGPDGLLYVLTEEDEAAVLRIEPAE